MQKTARQRFQNAIEAQHAIQQTTGISPHVGSNQFSYVGQTYQPTIAWQDTTSNATYSSASSVLSVT